jgi:uncharacterized membrane protein YfcA
MARTHHRKKHKEHLRQFKHSHDINKSKKIKTGASGVFGFGGVIAGILLGYFAGGSIVWMAVGLVAGGIVGYFIGRRIDREK